MYLCFCVQEDAPEGSRIRSSETDDAGSGFVIWGTNISVEKYKHKFKRFMEEYVEESPAQDEAVHDEVDRTLPLYLQKLEEV